MVNISNGQEMKDIELPLPLKTGGKPLMDALSQRASNREFSPRELSLNHLSGLLWAAYGINRPESGKHTIPTARNWQDMEVYAVLPSGIFLYQPLENKLKCIKTGNFMKETGMQDFVAKAPVNLVFVSDLSKMENTAPENKSIYAGIHAGAIAQNVYLYCASEGLNTVTRRAVDIAALAAIMGLPDSKMIVLAQTVGYKP